jgi:type I restriction-modification system DNA methylase subunit
MEESNNTKKLVSELWEAFEMLNGSTGTSDIEAFKAVFALFAYKRFSDAGIINRPKDCGWDELVNHSTDQFFVQLENNFCQLQTANELPDIARVLNLKQFNDQLPNNIKEHLINIIDGMDLSREKCSTDQVNEIVSGFFQGYVSKYPLSILENKSLNRLALELLDPKGHVYFPYCGLGDGMMQAADYYDAAYTMEPIDFEMHLNEARITIQGSIPNLDIWAVAVLRFLLADMPWIDVNNNEDYFIDPKRNLADVIFYSNPLDINLPSDVESTICVQDTTFEISHNQPELFILLQSLKHLNFGGRLGIVLPSSVLFKVTDNHKKVRKYLVEEDLLEAIVQLPSGLFPHLNLKLVLMIINTHKEKGKKNKFAFITVKATKEDNISVITYGSIEKARHVYSSFTSLINDQIASLEEIQRQNCNLQSSLYVGSTAKQIKKLLTSRTGRRLGDIARVIRSMPTYISGKIPVISRENLSNDLRNPYLNFEDVSYAGSDDDEASIKRKCIVVALIGGNLLPTIFDPEILGKTSKHTEILLGKDLAAIFPKDKVIDFDYLYYQLYSSLVKIQSEDNNVARMSSDFESLIFQADENDDIKETDVLRQLKQIVIPMLDKIEEQQSFTYQQKMELLKAENAKYEALRERLQIDEKKQTSQYEVLGFVAHTVKNEMPIAMATIDRIKEFLEENTLLDKQIFETQSAGNLLDKAGRALKQINSVVNNVRDFVSREFKREDFREVNISEIFENEIKPLMKKDFITVIVNCNIVKPVKINKDAFIWAISNILHNAETHGFPNQIEGAKVRFDIRARGKDMVIDYTNNGLPLPYDIDIQGFTTTGKKGKGSKGYGLGGAIIQRVIRDVHEGELEIIRDKNAIHLRMTIPLGD